MLLYSRIHNKHFGQARADGSALAVTELTTPAQARAGWRKLAIKRPFVVGKPHVQPPRCDTRVSQEDRRRFIAQCASEVA